MTEIILKEESYQLVGACMLVHAELGPGFLEAVYQEALERELKQYDIPFKRQVKLSLYYKEEKLKKYYIADFLCYEKIVLELKALQFLHATANDQLRNYLRATNLRLGMVINFGKPSLEYRRILNPRT
ncbi:GxxExxY protein [Flavobacteriaceae bacterium F89]|uniref:GxxExxY protein n=1 Tax=Cerina litoralis TaxID=2874477 RepID=A0AAE3JQW3_9FLAO|nr:GxxExxY protein [Cerina litoralis]MCG2462586.1 GxxExxY protein [Cerina litoralis]